MMSGTLGRRAAISLGVLMIPDPMQLPRATAIPKPTPKTRKKFPLGCRVGSGDTVISHRAYHESVLSGRKTRVLLGNTGNGIPQINLPGRLLSEIAEAMQYTSCVRIQPSVEMKPLKIAAAETGIDHQQVRELFAELVALDTAYMRELRLDLQAALDFYYDSGEEELPGVYSPPGGGLFLATYGAEMAGCGAFRRMTPDICELKRMYVRPEFRGKRIGWQLAGTLIQRARAAGYCLMRLETTTYLEKAIALYSALGFRTCQPYYAIPEALQKIAIFMELDLLESDTDRARSDRRSLRRVSRRKTS
jgi:GNAT superfamily N-acetyltransferase